MALVEEEVIPLESAAPKEDEEPPPSPPKLEKQPRVNWREKVECPGCSRLMSKHTLDFTHVCKGPKPERPPATRRAA